MSTATTESFPVYSAETAPEGSRSTLKQLKESVGMIPNLAGAMSQSPLLIKAFVNLRETVQTSSLTPKERETVFLTNAVVNGCRYCTAIHSTFGIASGLSQENVDLIRDGNLPKDSRLAALVTFVRNVWQQRGDVGEKALRDFLEAGFEKEQALDLIAMCAVSVIANFSGRLIHPNADDAIKPQYRANGRS